MVNLQPYMALFVFLFMAATLHSSFFKGFYYNSQLYQGMRWNSHKKFEAPMIIVDGHHYFTQNFVTFSHHSFGRTIGHLKRFFANVS